MIELFSGFFVGILASIVVWYVLYHGIVPSLEFLPAIYKKKTDENPSGYKYRIKFRNTGRRSLIDVELFAKLRIQGLKSARGSLWRAIYIPIDDSRIPEIGSQRGTNRRISVQLLLNRLDNPSILCLPKGLRDKCADGTIRLEELMNAGNNTTLEFYVFGYDSFSGARKLFKSMSYSQNSIENDI